VKIALVCEVTGSMTNGKYLLLHVYILVYNRSIIVRIFPFAEGFLPPKIVGTFYMQGYKVKEKTAIVPPVSKLSGHPDFNSRCVYIKYVIGWENLLKAVVMNEVYSN
jgi:hypothetical protein